MNAMRSGRPLFAMNRMRAVREWTFLARLGGSTGESAEDRKSFLCAGVEREREFTWTRIHTLCFQPRPVSGVSILHHIPRITVDCGKEYTII